MPQFKSILNSLTKFRCRVIKNYILHLGGIIKVAAQSILSLLGSASAKKLVVVEKKNMQVMQELIRKENLQQKYGGDAPNVTYGEDNLFPPIVPSNDYIKEDEELNIVTPEKYKEMCLESKPFKPFKVSENYMKLWAKEEEEKMKPSNGSTGKCLNDFIIEFENANKKPKNSNGRNKKYAPTKIDLKSVINFFNEMKSNNAEIND